MKFVELFSQAFRYGMNKGLLLNNPMSDIIVPKSTRPDKIIRALNIDEQQRLTDYLMDSSIVDEPYKNAFLIEMYMGIRIGEVLALKKENNSFHILEAPYFLFTLSLFSFFFYKFLIQFF